MAFRRRFVGKGRQWGKTFGQEIAEGEERWKHLMVKHPDVCWKIDDDLLEMARARAPYNAYRRV